MKQMGLSLGRCLALSSTGESAAAQQVGKCKVAAKVNFNACPGGGEMCGMQARGNATKLGDAGRLFLQADVRRACECRKGQLGDRVRRDARLRAEGMHSAADPDAGDRIACRRIAEAQMARRARQPAPSGQNPGSTPLR